MHFPAHFHHEISQSGQICNPYFLEQFTLLAALSHDNVHGNCHCNSICVCLYSFVSLFLPFSFSLISNLHLTPSWGKAPHSSTVFVPVTSKAPPAYQYQLRQCWACNLQLNVILLNPIWKLNIEKPLAYLPVFLPPLPSSLLAAIPSAPRSPSHSHRVCTLVFRDLLASTKETSTYWSLSYVKWSHQTGYLDKPMPDFPKIAICAFALMTLPVV